MDDLSVVQEQLKDHEDRLRSLEKTQIEMKYNLLSIEKGQSDLKLMVSEVNNNQNKLINKFIDSDLDIKKSNNKNIWSLIFKIWVVIAPIITGIAVYLGNGG
ncbi:hypothetical protein [Acetivibrio cellulolyticus]|uniref:hypothetical protein n=1 Tax=Acetivibrio cellulolyticus TaxID=35830 RepID=UPI0001E2C289|nr:hypothetical protein [Acetivibrio cellulolyticus]